VHHPTKYSNYVPSDSIVDQLLQLDDEEFAIPLSNGLSELPSILSCLIDADDELDINLNQSVANDQDPPSVRHAQWSKYWNEWLAAIHEELEALKAKEVYEEIDTLPHSRKAVQCKWVLHIKCDQHGQISRFKGHLVTKGFT
jgi:formate dehydrogenase maturation protein FdhE